MNSMRNECDDTGHRRRDATTTEMAEAEWHQRAKAMYTRQFFQFSVSNRSNGIKLKNFVCVQRNRFRGATVVPSSLSRLFGCVTMTVYWGFHDGLWGCVRLCVCLGVWCDSRKLNPTAYVAVCTTDSVDAPDIFIFAIQFLIDFLQSEQRFDGAANTRIESFCLNAISQNEELFN